MIRFNSVLYVTGENDDQHSAMERAVSLAENDQADLTVIDVIPVVMGEYPEDMINHRRQYLETLTDPYKKRLEIKTIVGTGTVFIEVIREVLCNRHDLVIKPAENPDFLKRVFGSTDIHLLRKCPCPVWIMKLPEKPKYSCIMAAVGFKPMEISDTEESLNLEILDMASSLALSDFTSVHVVHAWEAFAAQYIRSRGDKAHEAMAVYVEKERSLQQRGLDTLMEKLRQRIGEDVYQELSPHFHLPQGNPQKMIAVTAANIQADLVVMGTVVRTGVSGLIIGNTAEAILDQLDCSVLVIKPAGFVTPVKAE